MGQFSILRRVIFTGNFLTDLFTVIGVLGTLYGAALIHVGLVWGLLGLLAIKVGALHYVASARMDAMKSLAAAAKDGALSPPNRMEDIKGEGSSSGQYL